MKKKIMIILTAIVAVALSVLIYFNIIAPVKVGKAVIECTKWETLYNGVNGTARDNKNGEVDKNTTIYELESLYPAEDPEDYSCVSIKFEWKNRSLFETKKINCYIAEVDPSGMVMYSIDTAGSIIWGATVEPGKKETYGAYLYINLGDHTDEEVIEMLKTVTVHCVIEGEYTKTKEMDIKLSEVCDFSDIVIDRTYEE